MQLNTANSVESTLFAEDPVDMLSYGEDPDAPTPENDDDDDGSTVTVPVIDIPTKSKQLGYLTSYNKSNAGV